MAVTGKWNQNRYRIERLLGEGTSGRVYLVAKGSQAYAMKIGFDSLDLQSEVNILRQIRQMSAEPYLIDADDFVFQGKEYPFYVMKYIEGEEISRYIQARGADWFYIVGKNLLSRLCHLHAQGYIFGDLKPQNVLVHGYGCVELVDYGGVTRKGRAVKQYTECYDRGKWKAGSRTADEAYDLFAFAMLCLHVAVRLDRKQRYKFPTFRLDDGLQVVRTNPFCAAIAPFLHKALRGEFASSREAAECWDKLVFGPGGKSRRAANTPGLVKAFAVTAVIFLCTVYLVFR
jgi:serine/threonine-protein kinase